jgi:hypothetical protein
VRWIGVRPDVSRVTAGGRAKKALRPTTGAAGSACVGVVIHTSRVRRPVAIASVLAPLPVIAVAVAAGWPWWAALIPVLVVVAVVAELAGIYCGAMAALVSTAGVVLVVGRDTSADRPNNGIELGAMAALLLVAALFGTPADTSTRSDTERQTVD